MKKTRTRNGKVEVLCGGYVWYDTRKKGKSGLLIRKMEEVRVWMPASGGDYDDCGQYTDLLFETLKKEVEKRFTINREVTVSSCWRY